MSGVLEFRGADFWCSYLLLCPILSVWRFMFFKLWENFLSSLIDKDLCFFFLELLSDIWCGLIFYIFYIFSHNVHLYILGYVYLIIIFNLIFTNYNFKQHFSDQHWQRPLKKLMLPFWLMVFWQIYSCLSGNFVAEPGCKTQSVWLQIQCLWTREPLAGFLCVKRGEKIQGGAVGFEWRRLARVWHEGFIAALSHSFFPSLIGHMPPHA